jgi:photosystem II stability/assembly factor-like uncharacterized protein
LIVKPAWLTAWLNVGEQDALTKTSNGGQSSVAQSIGTHSSVQGLQFLDDSTDCLVGNNVAILAAVSGGSQGAVGVLWSLPTSHRKQPGLLSSNRPG